MESRRIRCGMYHVCRRLRHGHVAHVSRRCAAMETHYVQSVSVGRQCLLTAGHRKRNYCSCVCAPSTGILHKPVVAFVAAFNWYLDFCIDGSGRCARWTIHHRARIFPRKNLAYLRLRFRVLLAFKRTHPCRGGARSGFRNRVPCSCDRGICRGQCIRLASSPQGLRDVSKRMHLTGTYVPWDWRLLEWRYIRLETARLSSGSFLCGLTKN